MTPIVIELETQLEQEHMSTEEFMRLLSRPAPKLDAILCYWSYGGSILTYWLED